MAFSGHFRTLLLTTSLFISPLALAQITLLPPADTRPAREEKPIDLTPFAPADPHQYKKTIHDFHATQATTIDLRPTHEEEPLDLNHFAPADPDLRMDTVDQHWNTFAGAGFTSALSATKNSVFQVTADPYGERDQLSDPAQSTHAQYLLGFQRVFFRKNETLQRIGVGPTLSFDPITFAGQVEQYQNPALSNYGYRYKICPVNVDLEAQFLLRRHGLAHHVGVSPYFAFGAGASYVNLSYSETALGGAPAGTAYSFEGHQFTPLFIGGIGLQFDIVYKFFIRTDYRYLYRGDVELKNTVFQSPVKANLDTQSINFLLGYRFS